MVIMHLTERWMLGFVCVCLLSACTGEDTGPVVPPELEGMLADEMILNLDNILQRNGVREAVVRADTGYFWDDSTAVHVRGNVEIRSFNDETGAPRALLKSEQARLDEADNSVTAFGNAVLMIVEIGREIRSAEIHYSPERNRIWSDSATCSKEGDKVMEGSGFSADLEFTLVEVTNPRSRPGGDCF